MFFGSDDTFLYVHLFKIEICCNIKNVFPVTFDQLLHSFWIKSTKKKSKSKYIIAYKQYATINVCYIVVTSYCILICSLSIWKDALNCECFVF